MITLSFRVFFFFFDAYFAIDLFIDITPFDTLRFACCWRFEFFFFFHYSMLLHSLCRRRSLIRYAMP